MLTKTITKYLSTKVPIVNNIHHATHSRDFASIVCRWDYRYQRNHFQRSFSQILDKSKSVVNLVDNILVYGTLEEEHDDNLGAVLKKLQEAEITLNRRKYKIRQRSVKFLGYISVERGIESDKNKIKAIIINIERSENATEVKRFLGHGHYLKFIERLVDLIKPFREVIKKKK